MQRSRSRHLKAKALIDTLADRLTDVETEALGEPAAQRYKGALINKAEAMVDAPADKPEEKMFEALGNKLA